MKYKDPGYNRLLVGDLYHWELDKEEGYLIRQNSRKLTNVGG